MVDLTRHHRSGPTRIDGGPSRGDTSRGAARRGQQSCPQAEKDVWRDLQRNDILYLGWFLGGFGVWFDDPLQPGQRDVGNWERPVNDTILKTHEDTTRQNIHETAAQLVGHLGMTAVSFLAGAKDSKQAARWARADGPEPRPESARRLMVAHRMWGALSAAEDDYVARNWFIGSNPRLGEKSPLEALHAGDLEGAAWAAKAFIDRTDG